MTAGTTHETQTTPARAAGPGPDAGPTGPGAAWLVVARREVMVKVTDRTFLLGTLATVAIITALVVLQAVLGARTETFTLVGTSDATTMARAVERAAPGIDDDVKVTVRTVADAAAARAALTDESADAWLGRADGGWVLTTKSEPKDALQTVVTDVVRSEALRANASALGTTAEALERGASVRPAFLEGDADRAQLAQIVAFAFAFLFYLASLMFGVTLANSVVEEKQSRVVEIIATAIPVRHLLAGKVLGNTVLAVAQLAVYMAVGLVGLSFTSYSTLVAEVSGPVVWFVVFFLAGFVALACLWAVAGSLASRTEDLQATTTPLTVVVMTVLFGGLLLTGSWQTVASFVPPLSAVVMPIRLLQQDAAWWEAVLALVLLLATAAVTVTVGERLYRRSLLQSGGRVSLRQAWRAEE